MKKIFCLTLSLVLLCLVGCGKASSGENSNIISDISSSAAISQSSSTVTSQNSSKVSSSSTVTSSAVSAVTSSEASTREPTLTLEDKISRLFIVKPVSLNLDPKSGKVISVGITQINENIKTALKKYKVSGVILFDVNISGKEQLNSFTAELKKASSLPLFVSVDEEGGRVSRVINKFGYTNPGSALYLETPEKVKKAYESITAIIGSHGFNLNYAPVADVYTNPHNTVIGSRAFGRDPETVSKLLLAAMDGHKSIPHCVKHFPGHGDTSEDTHNGAVTLNKTWDELLKCEIIPFKAAIEQNCDMIMASHIILPNVTTDKLPTSLSYEMITEKLRNELGFGGVVITDSMVMGAIEQHYSSGQAAVMAVKAGVDLILCPADLADAHTAILRAVQNGEISEERIDESVNRIDALFKKYKIS